MCEVDHANDAENHRVADGDKSVDRPQRHPVDQLLQEIIHAPPWPLVSPRFAGNVPFARGRPVFARSRSADAARQYDRLPRFHSLAVAEARRNLSAAMFTGMPLTANRLEILRPLAE